MSRKRIPVLFFLAVLAALVWWWFRPSQITSVPFESKPSQSSNVALATPSSAAPQLAKSGGPVRNLPDTNQQKAYIAAFLTPISFWGKVVDEKGNPVPDARVKLGANDSPNPMNDGSTYERKTDANGLFSITGIHGITLGVDVSKEGYYATERSSGSAHYVVKGKSDIPVPTKETPAVFVLQKMGNTEPLIYVGTRYYKMTKDGQPIEIDLATGGNVPVGQGNIRFERWANDQAKDEKGQFDWRLRITIPEGGLVERQGEFNFEAPQEGYQNAVEINMPASLGGKWQYTVNKSYFIKLSDGRYARINALIQAGHNNTPLTLDSFVNPKPGSRNLEFDPKKVVKMP